MERRIFTAMDDSGSGGNYPYVYVLVSTTDAEMIKESKYRRRGHPKRFSEGRLLEFFGKEGNHWRGCLLHGVLGNKLFPSIFPILFRSISENYTGNLCFRLDVDGDETVARGHNIRDISGVNIDEVIFYPKKGKKNPHSKVRRYEYHDLLIIADSLANLLGRAKHQFMERGKTLPEFYRQIGIERNIVSPPKYPENLYTPYLPC